MNATNELMMYVPPVRTFFRGFASQQWGKVAHNVYISGNVSILTGNTLFENGHSSKQNVR